MVPWPLNAQIWMKRAHSILRCREAPTWFAAWHRTARVNLMRSDTCNCQTDRNHVWTAFDVGSVTSLQVVWSHDEVEGSLSLESSHLAGQAISNLVRTQGAVKRSTAAVGFLIPRPGLKTETFLPEACKR